jgi:hypothetical protein
MSTDFNTRMYNYEVAPPKGVWKAIAAELDRSEVKVISIEYGQRRSFSYMLAAASVTLIIFASMVLRMQSGTFKTATDGLATAYDSTTKRTYVMMSNPEGQEVKVSPKVAPLIVSANTSKKSVSGKKMQKWKNTMMAATTTNFLDVIDLAKND